MSLADSGLSGLQAELDACPAITALGMTVHRIGQAGAGSLILRLPLTDVARRAPAAEQFHGGAIASLIDTAGDYAVALLLGGGVPTINFRVDFLRPASGAYLLAAATVRRQGRTVSVADVDVFDPQQRLCAVGRGTYASMVG
ncbi:MAG: PaaI family thioesterase [Pseudomonadota bacterium]